MTAEKEYQNVFDAILIAEKEEFGVTFRIFSNQIFHVIVPKYMKIEMRVVEAGYAFLDEHGGGRYFNIFEFDSFADVDPEIREWAADSENNKYTHSDAIVIGSISQKIITDFYMRFNKPVKPTKVFYSLNKATTWTFEQMSKNPKTSL